MLCADPSIRIDGLVEISNSDKFQSPRCIQGAYLVRRRSLIAGSESVNIGEGVAGVAISPSDSCQENRLNIEKAAQDAPG